MQYRNKNVRQLALAISGIFVASCNAYAQDNPTLQDEVQTLKKEVAELRALIKQQSATQDEEQSLRKEVKETARTQFAWTNAESLSHIAGYAAVGYTDRRQRGGSAFSVASFNPIFHYQYRDINTIHGSGKVYVSSRSDPVIWVADQKTLKLIDTIKLPAGEGHQMVVMP